MLKTIFSLAMALSIVFGIGYNSSGEYTNRNAKIVARTSTVYSTISGRISGPSLVSGSFVSRGSPLATVVDARVSRESITNLESEVTSLKADIELASQQLIKVKEKQLFYSQKHDDWVTWLKKDLRLQGQQLEHELVTEELRFEYMTKLAIRAQKLRKDTVMSQSEFDDVQHDVNVASSIVDTRKAEYRRIEEKLRDLEAGLPVFEDGEVSYWYQKSDETSLAADELSARIEQNQSRLTLVKNRIAEESDLYEVQRREQHNARFDGLVNTVYVRPGDLVTPNTPILEILDCNQLTVIAPITASRQSYFFPGQKALIDFQNGEKTITGKVKLISTGRLLERDSTLPADQTLLRGHSLIITFDGGLNKPEILGPAGCSVETSATVTIEIDSRIDRFKKAIHDLISLY